MDDTDPDDDDRDRPTDLAMVRHPLATGLCGMLAVVTPLCAMFRLYGIFTSVNVNDSANVSTGLVAYGLAVVWLGCGAFVAFLMGVYRPGRRWAWWLGLAALALNAINPLFWPFLAVALPLWLVPPTRRHFGLTLTR